MLANAELARDAKRTTSYAAARLPAHAKGAVRRDICQDMRLPPLQVNADRNQQEQLQEKNEASTQQLEQQQRQSPGSVSQQQVTNKASTARWVY